MTAADAASPPASAGVPEPTSTSWSSASASPAPGSRSTPPAAASTCVAVDAHDLAFGTVRWSSKLVHGGLRYLAQGQVGVAHESAVERGILMQATAPHLVRALPMLMPLDAGDARGRQAALARRGGSGPATCCGCAARTARATLPRPRRHQRHRDARASPPSLRADGLRGGAAVLGRPARGRRPAGRSPSPAPRRRTAPASTPASGCIDADRDRRRAARRADRRGRRTIRARAVVNATGVWAGELVDEHPAAAQPRHPPRAARGGAAAASACAVMVPVPGASNRFVFVLPQPDGTLLRRPHRRARRPGRSPTCPSRREAEIDFLLDVVASALHRAADPRRRRRRLRRAAAAARGRRHGRDRRPVPPARGAHLRPPAWSPSSAAS